MMAIGQFARGMRKWLTVLLGQHPYATVLPLAKRLVLFVLMLFGVIGVGLFYLVRSPWIPDADERQASQLMYESLQVLHDMRLETGEPIDPVFDPAGSGMIGIEYSDITTSLGDLVAKQTSLNPTFAGLVVKWLKQAGVESGDRIAVTLSGSFPALNLAVLCASEVMALDPYIISSVGASIYGANIFGFTWLDMEHRLNEIGLLNNKSRYASLGGITDINGGVFETGIEEGEAAIARNGITYLREGSFRDVERDTLRRMKLYFEDGRPAAYVNVGGNVTAIGWINETHLLGNGLLNWFPPTDNPKRGLLFRMHEQDVPVIHLLNIERLAAANFLPVAPRQLSPDVDFAAARHNHLLWLFGLLAIWGAAAALALFGRDVGPFSPRRRAPS